MHALIFLGGEKFRLPERIAAELAGIGLEDSGLTDVGLAGSGLAAAADLVIAADSGWENALANGITPDLLVGDMDSISAVPEGVEKICVPAVKDDTDTQLAIESAIERGADRITLAGRLSGRADHTLSALFMLENLHMRGIDAGLVDDRNRVRVAQNERIVLRQSGYRYFGVLSLGTTVYQARGCRYEVDDTLRRSDPYAVSNEIAAECAELTFSGDPAFVIESE